MKMPVHHAIGLLALSLAACATQEPGSYLPDARTPEAQVYIEQCGGCHAVPHPQRLSAAAWKDMVGVMDKRRVERDYPPLSAAQREKLMEYLVRHARY